jgi:predicted nucleotidyltransferase
MTIQEIKQNGLLLFEAISGSRAYGTNTEASDTDFRGVFILPAEDLFGLNYIDQVSDETNDSIYYELGRFLQLLQAQNPNIIELLNMPEENILFKHPVFEEILSNKKRFLSKACKNSFAGYAIAQIKKARGLNKKQNWEKEKITRKELLDFIYVVHEGKTIPWKIWNSARGYEEKFCGVVNLPNARDIYAVYFDDGAYACFSELIPEGIREMNKRNRKDKDLSMGFGYRGLVKSDEGESVSESNGLRLSSIPKGETPIAHIVYNKDAYSQHCKDYKSYQEWITNRNPDRHQTNQEHGKGYDSKNMMHCIRLTRMALEIAETSKVLVKRPDSQELLEIRKGLREYDSLLTEAETTLGQIDKAYEDSNLPDSIDKSFINQVLVSIRKKFYNL